MECARPPIGLLAGRVGKVMAVVGGTRGEKDERVCGRRARATRRVPKGLVCPAATTAAFVAFLSALLILAGPTQAQQKTVDLANQSLEDLMKVKVVSVSKTEEAISRAAAAIFTQEDIRRSGPMNIPDLLRIVPGMDVAQIDASTWAISARGFNARSSDELFVMVDGRSVSRPASVACSGTPWIFRSRISSASSDSRLWSIAGALNRLRSVPIRA